MRSIISDNYIEKYDKILTKKECDYYISVYEDPHKQKYLNEFGNYVGVPFCLKSDNYLIHKLSNCVEKYKKKHNFLNLISEWGIENFCNIQKFSPGSSYSTQHMEHGPNPWDSKRVLVWMIYLNTIQKNGGTTWPQQKYTSKPKCGSLILWPSGWTHSHYGVPAKNQEKYIMTGWCSFT
jgi:hypothetical protein